jgi:hypothetical protein
MNSIPVNDSNTLPPASELIHRKRVVAAYAIQLMVEERFGAEEKADRQAFLSRCVEQMPDWGTVELVQSLSAPERECVVRVSVGDSHPPPSLSQYEYTLRWIDPIDVGEE